MYNKIDGCDLTCNYGYSCGASTKLIAKTVVEQLDIFIPPTTQTWTTPSDETNPFTLTVLNNVIEGYPPSKVCLHCTSNNLSPGLVFEKQMTVG